MVSYSQLSKQLLVIWVKVKQTCLVSFQGKPKFPQIGKKKTKHKRERRKAHLILSLPYIKCIELIKQY